MEKQKNFKDYKTLKIKSILKKENIICIVDITKPGVELKNTLSALGVRVLRVSNLDLVEVLQSSVLASYAALVSGSTSVITLGKDFSHLNLAELQFKVMKKIVFLSIIINNKAYLLGSLLKTKRSPDSTAKTIFLYSFKKKKSFFTLAKQSKTLLRLASLKKLESKQHDSNT